MQPTPPAFRATNREPPDIVGRGAGEAIPTDPGTLAHLVAAVERVIATGPPDTVALVRFDVPRPGAEGGLEERW